MANLPILETIIEVLSVLTSCAHSDIMQTNIYYITLQMFSLPSDATEYVRNYSGCCVMPIRM